VLGLGLGVWQHGLLDTLLGGAAGFGTMFALYLLGDSFARWIARRRGEALDEVALGFGDVNLLGVIGLILGWPGIVAGLVLGILIAGLVSFLYLSCGNGPHAALQSFHSDSLWSLFGRLSIITAIF